jgi:hypothetical protein
MKKITILFCFSCFATIGFSQTNVVSNTNGTNVQKSEIKENTFTPTAESAALIEKKGKNQSKALTITVEAERPSPKPLNSLTPLKEPKSN